MLRDVGKFIKSKGRVAFPELYHHFDVEADDLREMLDMFVHTGKIRCCQADIPCKGCTACGALAFEIYEWVGNA